MNPCLRDTNNYTWLDGAPVVYNKWNTPTRQFINPIVGMNNSEEEQEQKRLMADKVFLYLKKRVVEYHPDSSFGKCVSYVPIVDSWISTDCDKTFVNVSFVCEMKAPHQNKIYEGETLVMNVLQIANFKLQTSRHCS